MINFYYKAVCDLETQEIFSSSEELNLKGYLPIGTKFAWHLNGVHIAVICKHENIFTIWPPYGRNLAAMNILCRSGLTLQSMLFYNKSKSKKNPPYIKSFSVLSYPAI